MTRRFKKFLCLLLCLAIAFASIGSFNNIESLALTQAQEEYMEVIGAAATEDMLTSGILASLTVAQSILEAGWGTSTMAKMAKNLFGIKAYSSWTGMVYDSNKGVVYPSYAAYVTANTKEYVSSNVQRVWRAYSTWYESLADHSALLTGSSRYDDIPYEYDYVAAAWNIIEDGYASDMEYTKKIINCIELYNLTKYDAMSYPEDQVVIVTKTRKFLPLNEQWQLPVTVIQPFGAEDTLTYSSNNPDVATVDETGLITPVSDGECMITVTSSTGWHACCYIATYEPETAYAEYVCVGDIPMYTEASTESEKIGTLPSRHCIIGIGEKFQTEDGNTWMKVRAKVLIGTEVLVKTGYVLASGISYGQAITYTYLKDAVSITLDQTEISVAQYTSANVNAEVLAEDGKSSTSTTVRWISDNPSVATVNAGKIIGVSEGECTVYAVSTDGVYTSVKVTVTPGVYIPAESISLNQSELSLNINDTFTLTAAVTPEDATEPQVKWSSSNDLVAKVIRGKVTAMGEGECTITATVGELTATCTVTVVKLVYTGIKYDGTVMGNLVNLRQGPDTSYASHGFLMQDDTLVIYGEPTPNNWYSVLVTSGQCEGLEGYVYGDFVKILNEQVESLAFNTSDSILTVGDTLNLSWTVSPSESTVTFESSDANIVTVSENGVVAAIAEGTAVITAKAGELSATLNITVTESGFTGTKYIGITNTGSSSLNLREGPGTDFKSIGKFTNGTEITVYGEAQNGWYAVMGVLNNGTEASGYVSAEWVKVLGKYASSLALGADHATITEEETFTITWTVDPEDVEVTFTVSDENIATVDENGVITALKEGNTSITVYAGGKTATFVLNVLPKPLPPLPQDLLPKEGISVSEGYILGVTEMTTAEELLNMFENEAQYIVIESSNDSYVGTGTTVSLKDRDGNIIQTATVIVMGDCDGSGTISATDYLITRRIVMMTIEYTDIQYESARVSGMPSVTATDYLMVRRHFLGLFNLYTQTATE